LLDSPSLPSSSKSSNPISSETQQGNTLSQHENSSTQESA
jgi:hypothetical protein